MANRVIPVETKVKVMQECLRLVHVEEVAARYGVSPRSIYGWYAEKLQPARTDVLVNARPGPAPCVGTSAFRVATTPELDRHCPRWLPVAR